MTVLTDQETFSFSFLTLINYSCNRNKRLLFVVVVYRALKNEWRCFFLLCTLCCSRNNKCPTNDVGEQKHKKSSSGFSDQGQNTEKRVSTLELVENDDRQSWQRRRATSQEL